MRWPLALLFLLLFLGHARPQDSLNMRKLGRWADASLPPSVLYGNIYNAVWGYARDGHEYGIIGSTQGTHIINVSDPTAPALAAFVPGAYQSTMVMDRDYKVYRDRLYAVTDQGPGTLQIIDLRQLPAAAPVIYDSNALFARAHTLWIDTAHARMYTFGGDSDMAIWSLADPDVPTLILKPQQSLPWWNAVGPVHDGHVRDHIAYLNDMDAMHIVDFSVPTNAHMLGSLTQYTQAGYNHSGWLHENGWLYAMADETHGKDLKLFDVSDPGDIELVDTLGPDGVYASIAHNPCFKGDELHVSWYHDGYRLWNVSDPWNAQVLGYYDTYPGPYTFGYRGAWGVYPYLPSGHVLISDMQTGLYIIDIGQALAAGPAPTDARHISLYPNPGTDRVVLTLPEHLTGPANVSVFDGGGRLLDTGTHRPLGRKVQLDIRTLPEGAYIVRVSCNNGTAVVRLLKTFAP